MKFGFVTIKDLKPLMHSSARHLTFSENCCAAGIINDLEIKRIKRICMSNLTCSASQENMQYPKWFYQLPSPSISAEGFTH